MCLLIVNHCVLSTQSGIATSLIYVSTSRHGRLTVEKVADLKRPH